MNNNHPSPTPPPAPAVRFRVVAGSLKQSNPSQSSSTANLPPQSSSQQSSGQRFRPRLNYVRAPPGYHVQRSGMPFSRPMQAIRPRLIFPRMIRQPAARIIRQPAPRIIRQPAPRIIRPLSNPQQNQDPASKKKLIDILRAFLTRCTSTPEANLPQMVMTTEQYLKGIVSTSEYIRILRQNVKGVQDNLAKFLELHISAVRKDFEEKKIAMEEVVFYKVHPVTYLPSQTNTVSNEQQQSTKSELMPVSSHAENEVSSLKTPVTNISYQLPEPEDIDIPLTGLPHDIALKRSLLDPAAFSAALQRKAPGMTIDSLALLTISEYLETRIRKLIDDAQLAAEHRSKQFRSNPNFVEVENPRAQLKAMEKLEKVENQQKIDLEKKKLVKGSKTDQNKAKKTTKTNEEDEALNQQTNETAMLALRGKKRTWLGRKDDKSDEGPAAKKEVAIARANPITINDLLFAFERDSFAKKSIVYRKALYGLYNDNN